MSYSMSISRQSVYILLVCLILGVASADISYSATFEEPSWNMASVFRHSDAIWTTAKYAAHSGPVVAHGIASIAKLLIDGKSLTLDLFYKDDIKWEFLQPSLTETTSPQVGKIKYYDIVVEGKPTLKACAWAYIDPPAGSGIERYKDWVAFRKKTSSHFIGTGIYHHEDEGLHIDEFWEM